MNVEHLNLYYVVFPLFIQLFNPYFRGDDFETFKKKRGTLNLKVPQKIYLRIPSSAIIAL